MEKEIITTKYITATFDDETKIYASKYLAETRNMTDEEWRNQMLELKSLIETIKPAFIIDDNRERFYGYSPDMQIWTLTLFVDSWNNIGLKKYAQIRPKEIVGKLTTKQIEEFAVNDFKMRYQYKLVDDFESALVWINKK